MTYCSIKFGNRSWKQFPKHKCASLAVSAILLLNLLLATFSMASASAHMHQHEEILNNVDLNHVDSSKAHQHALHVHMEADNKGCCETPTKPNCNDHDVCYNACKTHCSQSVPIVARQHQVRLYLSYKVDLAASDDEVSVEPARRFKPPRLT